MVLDEACQNHSATYPNCNTISPASSAEDSVSRLLIDGSLSVTPHSGEPPPSLSKKNSNGKRRAENICDSELPNTSKSQKTDFNIPESVLNNKYDKHCQGPYEVIVQSSIDSAPSLHPLSVGRLIVGSTKQDVIEIKKMGYSKILVQMKSRDSANALIANPIFKSKNLVAYIPDFRVSRQGIIKNVPLDITTEELSKEIETPFEIASIRRLNRRNPAASDSNSPTYIPSKTVNLTFKGSHSAHHAYA